RAMPNPTIASRIPVHRHQGAAEVWKCNFNQAGKSQKHKPRKPAPTNRNARAVNQLSFFTAGSGEPLIVIAIFASLQRLTREQREGYKPPGSGGMCRFLSAWLCHIAANCRDPLIELGLRPLALQAMPLLPIADR